MASEPDWADKLAKTIMRRIGIVLDATLSPLLGRHVEVASESEVSLAILLRVRTASRVAKLVDLLEECQPIIRETSHTAECMAKWDDQPGLQVCTCHIGPLRSGIAAILKEHPHA